MISKDERERDRAICEAATQEWRQGHHVGEPKAICAAATPDESLLMLDKDGMAIFWREVDARAAVNAVNRLPTYIADAEKMDRREQRLRAFVREIATGYDHEEDAHRHRNGACRVCNAERLAAELGFAIEEAS